MMTEPPPASTPAAASTSTQLAASATNEANTTGSDDDDVRRPDPPTREGESGTGDDGTTKEAETDTDTAAAAAPAENPSSAKKADLSSSPGDDGDTTEETATVTTTVKETRLAALRTSRETDPDLTHKRRLEQLQSSNPALWGTVKFKVFKKLVQADNGTAAARHHAAEVVEETALASLSAYMQIMASMGAANLGGRDYDENEDEERAMNCGFTEDEADDLLCQGVKPWDDDADDVLDALGSY